jgi:hypothetical protein
MFSFEKCYEKSDQFFGAVSQPKDTSGGCQKEDVSPSVGGGGLKGAAVSLIARKKNGLVKG